MRRVVVLVCILSLIVTAAVLVGCGSGGSSSMTPEEAVEAFWTAALKQDADSTWAMLSKSGQEIVKDKAAWAESLKELDTGGKTITFEVGKATVTGDKATVSVKFTADGKELSTNDMTLVKEGGAWKFTPTQ